MHHDPIETPSRPSAFAPPPPVREATVASDPRYWAPFAVTLTVDGGGGACSATSGAPCR
jgi:hypothetical protein